MEDFTSAQDRALLDAMVKGDRSGDALSKATGRLLTAEEAALRVRQLMDGADLGTSIVEFQLIIWKARQMVGRAEEAWDDGEKGAGRLLLDTLRFISQELKDREALLASAEVRVNSVYAGVMVEAIGRTLTLVAKELSEAHEIPLSEIEGIFQEALPVAAAAIDGERAAVVV